MTRVAATSRRLQPSPRRALRLIAVLAMLIVALVRPTHAGDRLPGSLGAFETATTSAVMVPPAPGRAKEFALIRASGLFHMFYIRENLLIDKDSTSRDFGHAVSSDLVHWTQLAPVLQVRPDKWDNGHVWAPHVVEQDGTYYMYYVGVTMEPFAWTWYQRIGLATSTDLMNWTRYDQPVYGGNMVPWAYCDSSQFDGAQFRDPYVMEDPDHPGQWLMYYVTEPATAHGQLIVGAARNSGGFTPWQDVGALWCTDSAHYWGWVESPCVFKHGALWYMFTTTTSGHVLNFRTAPNPLADSTQWSGKYRLWDMVGQNPQSDSWFGVEHMLVDGHDLLGYVDPYDSGIDINEMIWGTPPNFSLASPAIAAASPGPGAPALEFAVLGHGAADGTVVFRLSLPAATSGRLELFDVNGRRVRSLDLGALARGVSLARWDGRTEQGARATRGIYFARLLTPSGQRSARVFVTD